MMASTNVFGNDNSGLQAGTINGPVQASFHYATAPSETPPEPLIVIPFARDKDFVERGSILKHVEKRCTEQGSWTALVGLGGVGKSQLAIEHAYRTREQSPETWVLWARGSSAARLEQSFRDIADTVRLAGRQDPQANVFKLMHDWLRGCKHRWLLILDNVDDVRFLVNRPAADPNTGGDRPLLEYLPRCGRGSVLVTTRNRQAALKLMEQRDIVVVEPMGQVNAITLLEKKLQAINSIQYDRKDVGDLAAILEYMPLAIVQAAAYILQHSPRCSVAKYLVHFRNSEREKTNLLEYDGGYLPRDQEATNSIITTWQISFEHIRHTRPSAADLLSLMSFFDPQGIPEELLKSRGSQEDSDSSRQPLKTQDVDSGGNDDALQSSVSDSELEDNTFEGDVVTLRNFCLISDEADGTSFVMHALVQLATRTWLTASGELGRWKQQFIGNLSAAFPTGTYENWAVCQKFYVHAKIASLQELEERSSLLEWARLLYHAAWYAWQRGNAADSEKLALKSLDSRQKVFGENHKDTLSSMGMLGLAYCLGGHHQKAAGVQVKRMNASKLVLGSCHPNTLTSMGSLAATYIKQGRWEDAEKLQVEVLEVIKTDLVVDYPHTLASMNNLATTYRNQGRWDEAEELEVEVMETSKAKLGAEHPDTLTSMANLASTFWSQGRWNDAEELQLEVVKTSKAKLGAKHPDTLSYISNLAATYRDQGRWDKAEELEAEVVNTSKTELGAEHPDTLSSMHNLALIHRKQGQWKKAIDLDREVLEIRKTKLGPHHPDTLSSTANLASTNRDQGQLKIAEELFVGVLKICKRRLGAEHLLKLTSEANLASIYRDQSRWDEAEKLEVKVMKTSKAKLGVEHPHTLSSMRNLASTYWNQGRWEEAEELEVEVMETRKTKLGVDHPDTLSSMHNLAFTWRSLGRDAEAMALMQECVQLRREVLRENHPDLVSSLQVFEQWEAEEAEEGDTKTGCNVEDKLLK